MNEDKEKVDERDETDEIDGADAPGEEESFAEMLRESFSKPVRFDPGQKVKVRIVKISAELVFLDLGGKSEGYLDRKELLDEEGNLSVTEGDDVEAYFLSSNNNELRFTTQITGGDAGRYYLEEAWEEHCKYSANFRSIVCARR